MTSLAGITKLLLANIHDGFCVQTLSYFTWSSPTRILTDRRSKKFCSSGIAFCRDHQTPGPIDTSARDVPLGIPHRRRARRGPQAFPSRTRLRRPTLCQWARLRQLAARLQPEGRRGTAHSNKLCQHLHTRHNVITNAYLVVSDELLSHGLERREYASMVDAPIRIRTQCQYTIPTVDMERISPVLVELLSGHAGLSFEKAGDSDSHAETRLLVDD